MCGMVMATACILIRWFVHVIAKAADADIGHRIPRATMLSMSTVQTMARMEHGAMNHRLVYPNYWKVSQGGYLSSLISTKTLILV